jgi:hypothetical protein
LAAFARSHHQKIIITTPCGGNKRLTGYAFATMWLASDYKTEGLETPGTGSYNRHFTGSTASFQHLLLHHQATAHPSITSNNPS